MFFLLGVLFLFLFVCFLKNWVLLFFVGVFSWEVELFFGCFEFIDSLGCFVGVFDFCLSQFAL